MPECDGATVDVQPIWIDGQTLQTSEHLGGKRFVELDEIDLVEREPGLSQHFPNGRNRSQAEQFWRNAGGRVGGHTGEGFETESGGAPGAHQQEGGGTDRTPFGEIARRCGVVVVTHDVYESLKIVDYLYFVSEGRIVAEGTPDAVRASKDPFVRQFVDGAADGPVPFHYPARAYAKELFANVQ
jgi:hypothetical protein